MVHRAILGSMERFIAIITEHFAGKWPFWLSPRQVLVIPVALRFVSILFQPVSHYLCKDTERTLSMKYRKTTLPKYNKNYQRPESGLTLTTARTHSRRRSVTEKLPSITSSLSWGRRKWMVRRSMLGIVMMLERRRPELQQSPSISLLRSSSRSRSRGAFQTRLISRTHS